MSEEVRQLDVLEEAVNDGGGLEGGGGLLDDRDHWDKQQEADS